MRSRAVYTLVMLAGCGRFDFGGRPDGAIAADAVDAPAATVCPDFAVFCDGFETGDYSKWTGANTAGADVMVDSGEVHRGNYALDAAVLPSSGNGGEGDVYFALPVQSSGVIAVRVWIYSVDPNINYTSVINVINPTTNQYVTVVATDVAQWSVTDSSVAGGLHSTFSTVATTQDVWTCVELDSTLGPSASNSLYINDALVDQGGFADPAPAYGTIDIGATRADTIGYHVLDDDVVIAHQHIGC